MPEDDDPSAGGLRSHWRLIRRMFAFLAPVKFHALVTSLVFIAYSGCEILTIYLLKYPVNIVKELAEGEAATPGTGMWSWLWTEGSSGQTLCHTLLWLAGARLLLSVIGWAKHVTTSWQSMSMVYFMREAVYDKLQRVGFSFHDQHSTGQLINRALGDLQNVRMFVNQGLFGGIDIVFTLIGCIYLLVAGSPLMAAAALLALPPWFFLIRRFAEKSQPIYQSQMDASDEVARVLTENVAGVHVIRAFATEDQEQAKYRKVTGAHLDTLLAGVSLQKRMMPLIRGVAAMAHVLLFALGAVLVQQGTLNLGDLVVFGTAMGLLLARVQMVNQIIDFYQRSIVSSKRLFEILDTPDSVRAGRLGEPLRPGGGAVRFERVTFGYESGKPVLEDVSFYAPAGSKLAIVGPTGSGKTTLAGLLARFYDPDLGRIEIDRTDLRDATLRSVREAVGYVFQENYLFSDTVARNIAYAELAAPLHKIQEAARIAQADEFIEELPYKYHTVIGEYGASLSGGQRQRLAIARALLHNPRILVLDDALSAVDPETEAQIRAQLERIMAGRTVFLITSRISTARQADQILVLQKGRITQRGTHAQLMKEDGYYRAVAGSQFAAAEDYLGHSESHMDRVTRASARRSGRLEDE